MPALWGSECRRISCRRDPTRAIRARDQIGLTESALKRSTRTHRVRFDQYHSNPVDSTRFAVTSPRPARTVSVLWKLSSPRFAERLMSPLSSAPNPHHPAEQLQNINFL